MTFPQENAAPERNFKHRLVYGNRGMFTQEKKSHFVFIFDRLDPKRIYESVKKPVAVFSRLKTMIVNLQVAQLT